MEAPGGREQFADLRLPRLGLAQRPADGLGAGPPAGEGDERADSVLDLDGLGLERVEVCPGGGGAELLEQVDRGE